MLYTYIWRFDVIFLEKTFWKLNRALVIKSDPKCNSLVFFSIDILLVPASRVGNFGPLRYDISSAEIFQFFMNLDNICSNSTKFCSKFRIKISGFRWPPVKSPKPRKWTLPASMLESEQLEQNMPRVVHTRVARGETLAVHRNPSFPPHLCLAVAGARHPKRTGLRSRMMAAGPNPRNASPLARGRGGTELGKPERLRGEPRIDPSSPHRIQPAGATRATGGWRRWRW